MQGQRDVIAATGIIENIGSLSAAAGTTAVGSAECDHSLVIHIHQFPIRFSRQRSRAAADTGAAEKIIKLTLDFSLLFQQRTQLVVRANISRMIVTRLRG